MPTSWEDINEIFYHKVEEDSHFFNYFNLTEEESMKLAHERATAFLTEAAARLSLSVSNGVNFLDYDSETETFNFDLTETEKYLLACLQYEIYLSRNVAKLRVMQFNFTPSTLNVFSPANERNSFMEMYKSVQAENERLIDLYASKDRLSNTRLGINYASYDEE